MTNFMDSMSQMRERKPFLSSMLSLGPTLIYSLVVFIILRSKVESFGPYSFTYFHIFVGCLFMFYFERKLKTKSKMLYSFVVLIHTLFLIFIFIMTVYTFFLGTRFLEMLENQKYFEEEKLFAYYFNKKIGFGIALIVLILVQVQFIYK